MTSTTKKLGVKRIVFLCLFGILTLAYMATPLVVYACPGANNNNNNDNNNNNNDNNNNNNDNNNNNNNNANNNNNNANNNANNSQSTRRSSRTARSAKAVPNILLTFKSQNVSQSVAANRIACVQILYFNTQKPITFSSFQGLAQQAKTQSNIQVQTRLIGTDQSQVCNTPSDNQNNTLSDNQSIQPLANSLAQFTPSNQPQLVGKLTLKTDNNITIIADPTIQSVSVVNPTSIKVPLRFSDSDPLLQSQQNGLVRKR